MSVVAATVFSFYIEKTANNILKFKGKHKMTELYLYSQIWHIMYCTISLL